MESEQLTDEERIAELEGRDQVLVQQMKQKKLVGRPAGVVREEREQLGKEIQSLAALQVCRQEYLRLLKKRQAEGWARAQVDVGDTVERRLAELPPERVEEWCGCTPCWVARKVQEEQFTEEEKEMVNRVTSSANPETGWMGEEWLNGDMALRCYTSGLQRAMVAM